MTHQSQYTTLGFLISDVSRLFRRQFDQQAVRSGLTRSQWQVLVSLRRNEGLNQASLADLLDMEPITLSRHIDRLEANGWVERRPDPTDRRAHRLYVSPKTGALMEEMRKLAQTIYGKALSGVAPEAVEGLTATLGQMKDNLVAQAATERPAARSRQRAAARRMTSPTLSE